MARRQYTGYKVLANRVARSIEKDSECVFGELQVMNRGQVVCPGERPVMY